MKVGITGGIACGKSVILGMFAEAGWQTLSADSIVHELLDQDQEVYKAVVAGLGKEVIGADGTLDKKEIADIVFSNTDKRIWLEGLLHPRVHEQWTASVAKKPDQNWAVEIPLLFEKKLEKYFNLVVCLACSQKTQLSRLCSRGLSEANAKARITCQAPLAEKIEKSDIVLSNTGSLDFLRKQFSILLQKLN
ncbi:MAG: dephospho-CoA kinase [Opitutae bacterium]|nr:dephospho-CoA kinase [Opitutae bacterium]MBT5379382.1 dephospho-CoA kinase [Opitutae bacterium]MBT6461460.1 dephospho-CoA kinase [Opitutae bacterium]MBT6957794.1 dephospho-CoA kinase [Opitutae bacterium]